MSSVPSYPDDTTSAPQDEIKGKDTALPAYRYAKTLVAAARARSKSFQPNWDKFMGRYNWVSPTSPGAQALANWCFKGVVNWTFATIKTKASMILGAPSDIHVEASDDESTYYDRLLVKSAEEHLLKSVRFDDVKRDAYISGSVTGVGISMWQYRPDPITGAYKLVLVPIKSDEFGCDPSVDSITHPDCRYVTWSTDMDMSRVRELANGKAKDVKPDPSNVADTTGMITYTTPGDSNLLYGEGQPATGTPNKNAATRKAKVHFVWVKDETLIEELRDVLLSEARPGLWCADCAQSYEVDAVESGDECPACGSPMENVTIPPNKRTDTTIGKAYPYGRLIIYSGDVLIFDGQNPCHIDGYWPFAVYHHDRVPGEFLGANDVDLTDSLQDAQNRTVGQIIDSTRLSLNGIFVYPISAKSFTAMGVTPAERHPVPDHLVDKPRFVSPDSTNLGLAQLALSAIKEQFVIVTGLGGPTLGEVSSPPISATEAEIGNARLSDRMKGHAREFAAYCSDVAEIGRQLAVQFYDGAQTVPVQFPDSTVKDVQIEWQNLPNVRVKVSINPQESIRDKQMGQVVSILATPGPTGQAPIDGPYADVLLEAAGIPPNRIKELMDKRGLAQELQQQAAPPMGPGMPPPPGAPPPLELMQGGANGFNPEPA